MQACECGWVLLISLTSLPIRSSALSEVICAAGNAGRRQFSIDGRSCCVRTSQTFPSLPPGILLWSAARGMCVTEIGICNRAGVRRPDLDLFYYLPLSVQHLLDPNHSHATINVLDVIHTHCLGSSCTKNLAATTHELKSF